MIPARTHCWQGSLSAHPQMEVGWGGPHLAGLPVHQVTAQGSLTCARTARLKGNQFLKWIFEGGLQPCDPGRPSGRGGGGLSVPSTDTCRAPR